VVKMKSYNVVIKNKQEVEKMLTVKVESEEDFVRWIEILSNFERGDEISYKEIIQETKKEVF
tara:strand:+ start:480 stop:665 length:186 start_codon:yes stop_codon:yes gene_type:complete